MQYLLLHFSFKEFRVLLYKLMATVEITVTHPLAQFFCFVFFYQRKYVSIKLLQLELLIIIVYKQNNEVDHPL